MQIEQATSMENLTNITSTAMNNLTKTASIPADEPKVTKIAQSVIGVIGIFGNLCVILTFSTNKRLRKKIINMYIINQVSIIYIFYS